MKIQKTLLLILLLSSPPSFSAEKEVKGILPELKINSTDENENHKKSLQSEVLITKTENQAIQSLIAVIQRKKGTASEPDLWNRLAELYMRRAKSGRFFDLNRDSEGPIRFIPPEISGESAIASLKRAVQVYTKIEREFPNFKEMDAVFFNNAFASQQLKLEKNAEALYFKVVSRHPKSPLVPDAYLALGEIAYQKQNFSEALDHFKAIEKYPASRVFSYGMYKQAWTLYNLKQNEEALQKLIQVVKFHDPSKQSERKVSHNLRAESLRDLAIFYGETQEADKAYEFFSKIANPLEVGEAIHILGKLYDSHSRHKEMTVILTEYLEKQPLSRHRVKLETLLILGNETARARPEALKHLVATADLCKPNSAWRTAHADIAEAECDYDFAKTNIDMAKKWWDLWQKNKSASQAKEIAEYTQEAFRIHLDREDPKKPDTKSRYAYAELQFQLGNFRKASEQYEFVARKSIDTQISHDSSYSAIVSLEKASQKEKQATDDEHLVQLSQFYLEKYPQGEHAVQLRFKIGFIAYEHQNMNEAEKWLRPLASDEKAGEFKQKSEDLILDILNARKDYAGIKTFSQTLLTQTPESGRKKSLEKIMTEANYSEIQEYSQTGNKSKAAEKLVEFYQTNKTSPLAKNSLWQALSLYYADGKVIQGAETALIYAQAYPEDKRSLDALKDAAKYYSESGLVVPAANTMELIARTSPTDSEKYVEAASELYLIEGQIKAAQETLKKQLTDANKKNHGKIYAKLLLTMKGQESSSEFQKLEEKIVSLNIQPYAGEIRVKRVEALLAQGKLTEAFNSAKPLVSSDSGVEEDVRARARLVQAQVLEKEFIETRTKTTIEKLAIVLGIKTEKLDKAQTAYLTAAKIAKDPGIKLKALQGLNRIYTNFVDTVGNPILKDESTLSNEDKKALAEQLAKLTTPMLEKKIDTDKQLQNLAKESKAAGSTEIDFANLPAQETVKPRIAVLPASQLKAFLPQLGKEGSLFEVSRMEKTSEKCLPPEPSKDYSPDQIVFMANACLLNKNVSQTEKWAMVMTRLNPQSPLGPFYLGQAAELKGQHEKSAWLIDLALKKSANIPFLLYQKGRALSYLQNSAQANEAFLKAHDLGLKTTETILLHGIISFAQGDCFSVMDDFTKLERREISQYGLAPAMSECQAQKGEFDKSISFAEELIKKDPSQIDLHLEIGRIHEIYRFDSSKASLAYQAALKVTKNPDQKDWLQRKLDFLNGKRTVTSTGGSQP